MSLEERTGFGIYTLGVTAIDDHFALPMRFGKITWERRPVFIALSVCLPGITTTLHRWPTGKPNGGDGTSRDDRASAYCAISIQNRPQMRMTPETLTEFCEYGELAFSDIVRQ
jgi:hypothetical protein